MIILGIETSCDDTAAAILDVTFNKDKMNFLLLSNIVSSQAEIHASYGGVVPEIASRSHVENISYVTHKALECAGLSFKNIEAVAVTCAPGLIGSLLVGVCYAKSLSYSLGVPLIPVNHIEAHASAVFLEYPDIPKNFLALIVSGGHTSFYSVSDYIFFSEIGSTRDDAVGEAFDKAARVMGFAYPGGAAMDKLASKGFLRKSGIRFPSPALTDDSLDFSFSGLKTAVINYIHNEKQKHGYEQDKDLPPEIKEDIAASFTESIVSGICKKLNLALAEGAYKCVVMAGGVAANSHLRYGVSETCHKAGIKLYIPSPRLCGDNAAMTAAAGAHMLHNGITADSSLNAYPSDDSAKVYFSELMLHKHQNKA